MTTSKKNISLIREIEVAGYKAKINVKFTYWDNMGGKVSYYTSVSETAKAIKAIAKAAGFEVLRCKSETYSGGDSVDIYVKSELSIEDQNKNREILLSTNFNARSNEITFEPREKLLHSIVGAFERGSFNGMEDIYEYSDDCVYVDDPSGNKVDLSTKYGFEYFVTERELNESCIWK